MGGRAEGGQIRHLIPSPPSVFAFELPCVDDLRVQRVDDDREVGGDRCDGHDTLIVEDSFQLSLRKRVIREGEAAILGVPVCLS